MKTDLYETITARIVAQMEAGVLPWIKPWQSEAVSGGFQFMPISAVTGKAYTGINVLLLWSARDAAGYGSPRWLTYKQAQAMGGNVRHGEKGTMAVYADKFIPKAAKIKAADTGETARAIPFLKQFWLFNVEQCDGLPVWDAVAPAAPIAPQDENPEAEAMIAATGAVIAHDGGDRAFYQTAADRVHMPARSSFANMPDYYATVFHELTHWTGHTSRLAREFGKRFGDGAYAFEELIAELGAAFVCGGLSIEPKVRHADYLASWLRVLKSDNRAIFTAASQASKAATWIVEGKQVAPIAIAA